MRTLLLAMAATFAASGAEAPAGDPAKQATDWKAVVMAAARGGALKDAKACGDCLSLLGGLDACQDVQFDSSPSKAPAACSAKDVCTVEIVNDDEKIIESMRKDKKCSAAAADPLVIKKASQDRGQDVTPALLQCGRCVTPADLAKWPERKRGLMQLLSRFGEAEGKTDAASRAAALTPLIAEAAAEFTCFGGKIEPASCALKR